MEIGSFFEFPQYDSENSENSVFFYLTTKLTEHGLHFLFTQDGRQAIKSILKANLSRIKDHKCYLPSYLCDSILQPFTELGLKCEFYALEPPFAPKIPQFITNSVIFLLDYFGSEFISNQQILHLVKAGNFIILDITHSIFNEKRFNLVDPDIYLVSSLRKIFPIPDGGIIYHNSPRFECVFEEPKGYESMLEAMFLKKAYSSNQTEEKSNLKKEYFLNLYRNYESWKDLDISHLNSIPQISLHILQNIDFLHLLFQRKANLQFLTNKIKKNFLLFQPESIISPFFLPIVFEDQAKRDSARTLLTKNDIFPPVHWSLPTKVPKSFIYERQLSQRILSLPVDQRYDEKSMEKYLSAVPELFEK